MVQLWLAQGLRGLNLDMGEQVRKVFSVWVMCRKAAGRILVSKPENPLHSMSWV